jgi:REP element-mobilizing transposase RayT
MDSVNFEEIKTDARYNWQHLYFVSKKRRRVFRKQKTIDCVVAAFQEVEEKFGYEIRELGFGEDLSHVHMIVNVPSVFSLKQTIQIFKSHSASKIFRDIPNFLKLYPDREFWSGWRYNGSVGPMTEKTVKHYIQKQDIRQRKLAEFS